MYHIAVINSDVHFHYQNNSFRKLNERTDEEVIPTRIDKTESTITRQKMRKKMRKKKMKRKILKILLIILS